MVKYTNNSEIDLYYDNDKYDDLLYQEENEKYGECYNDYQVIFFPEVAYDFIGCTFYDSMEKQARYSDVLKFTILFHSKLHPYIHSDYYQTINDSDFQYHTQCIQAFITSVFYILPNEIICLILIGRNNYLKFTSI